MNLIDTNVILFYGEQAVSHFADFVNQWTKLLLPDQWDNLRFALVSHTKPSLESIDDSVWNSHQMDSRSQFFDLSKSITADDFESWLNSPSGRIKIHTVYSPSQADADGKWLISLLDGLSGIHHLTVSKLFYFLLSRESPQSSRETLGTLTGGEEIAFLLGTKDENGGAIPDENRWQAVTLAVLLAACEKLSLGGSVFSLGYSALNAGGSELVKLSERAACKLLLNMLTPESGTVTETEARKFLCTNGLSSEDGLHRWLEETVREKITAPGAEIYRNVWSTIRMCEDGKQPLEAGTALMRMADFIDMNYGGERVVREANEFAYQVGKSVREKLRHSIIPACFPLSAIDSLIQALDRIANEDLRPRSVSYPKASFFSQVFARNTEAHVEECKDAVRTSIEAYRKEKCISVFANSLAKTYREIRSWLARILRTDEDSAVSLSPKDLLKEKMRGYDTASQGSTSQLQNKYSNFSHSLDNDNPALDVLLKGLPDVCFFSEDGEPEMPAWNKLIRKAGQNLAKRVNGYGRGFFNYLHTEFSDENARKNFFDEYLKAGPRMYHCIKVPSDTPSTFLLAEEELSEGWTGSNDLLPVNTDNAENLALYIMKGGSVSDILAMDEIHFKGTASGSFGENLRRESHSSLRSGSTPGSSLRDSGSWVEEEPEEDNSRTDITLNPDENGDYLLKWKWKGNDTIATVSIQQYGEQIGKVSSIGIQTFTKNDSALNVTKDIMGGKSIPFGTLTVHIKDMEGRPYLNQDVQGRRVLIKYKNSGCVLMLSLPDGKKYLNNIALRTTCYDGSFMYYPLYSSAEATQGEKYQNLKLDDAKIVLRPSANISEPISIVAVY